MRSKFGLFVAEVLSYGGPDLDADRLFRHTLLYAATMGVAWLLDVPALIRARFGAATPNSRTDPRRWRPESGVNREGAGSGFGG